jgi:hypothetical protein
MRAVNHLYSQPAPAFLGQDPSKLRNDSFQPAFGQTAIISPIATGSDVLALSDSTGSAAEFAKQLRNAVVAGDAYWLAHLARDSQKILQGVEEDDISDFFDSGSSLLRSATTICYPGLTVEENFRRRAEIIPTLLELGFDPSVENKNGQDALEQAISALDSTPGYCQEPSILGAYLIGHPDQFSGNYQERRTKCMAWIKREVLAGKKIPDLQIPEYITELAKGYKALRQRRLILAELLTKADAS